MTDSQNGAQIIAYDDFYLSCIKFHDYIQLHHHFNRKSTNLDCSTTKVRGKIIATIFTKSMQDPMSIWFRSNLTGTTF